MKHGSVRVDRLMKNFHIGNTLTPVYVQQIRFCVDVCKVTRILPIRTSKNRDFEDVRYCEVEIVKAQQYHDDTGTTCRAMIIDKILDIHDLMLQLAKKEKMGESLLLYFLRGRDKHRNAR